MELTTPAPCALTFTGELPAKTVRSTATARLRGISFLIQTPSLKSRLPPESLANRAIIKDG
jgi:hypothetical protein